MDIKTYITENREKFLSSLSAFLAIPSVSTQPEHKKHVEKAANWLIRYLRTIGLKHVQKYTSDGSPIVFGSFSDNKNQKTLLIYGHYDVQPPEPLEKWKTPPFVPTIKNDKIFARGSSDNKGQMMINFFALEYFLKERKKLPLNIKVIIEGEEEIGGKHLEPFIRHHHDLLKADYALISDSSILSKTKTSIDYGLRGIVYFEMEIAGPKQDIHSGTYGGIIQNPTNAAAQIIARMQNDNGDLLIPGIYKNVRKLSQEEKALIADQVTKEQIKKETGVSEVIGDRNLSVEEIVGARPSLDVHGIWGGFRKQGEKTIIPDKVTCKFSIRTVPYMTWKETSKLVVDYIKNIKPRGVKIKIKVLSAYDPYLIDYKNPLLKIAGQALTKSFGVVPKYSLDGGSIPVTMMFKRLLKIDTVLLGYGLPDDNLHGPNEKMDLSQIWKGIESSVYFFEKLGKRN